MRLRHVWMPAMAVWLAAPMGTAAQGTRTAADIITVVGCVQGESEYRKEVGDGRGGTAGTGVGVGNEYVLRNVRTVETGTLQPTMKTGPGFEAVYSLTGNLERELAKAVGRQVAVSGYVEVAQSAGTDKLRDLPRFNASGWHVVAERCAGTTPR